MRKFIDKGVIKMKLKELINILDEENWINLYGNWEKTITYNGETKDILCYGKVAKYDRIRDFVKSEEFNEYQDCEVSFIDMSDCNVYLKGTAKIDEDLINE